MANDGLPPQLRDQIEQFQNLQNQVMMIAQQKAQYEAQTKELERAKEALGGVSDEAPVYKSMGAFLVKTDGKGAALKDIEEEHETLNVRVKNLERQESRLRESLNELQSKIEHGLARARGQAPAGRDDDDDDED